LPDLLRVLKTIRLSKADVERLEPQPLSEEEITRLLKSVPVCFPKRAAKITALIRLQISTGMAVRDAVQLERSNIEGGWLRIKRQKTGKPVEQKLSEGLCAELLAVAGRRCIFWSGKGRGETVALNYLDDLRVIMQTAGLWIPGNTSHRFRDTAVDYWLGNGASLLEAAALLGDSVPIVERHYRKLLSKRLQDRLSKVPMREWS
jgi:integrase